MHTGLLAFDGIETAVTPDEAASNLPISAALVRKWASLGHIQPVDIRGRQKLYRYCDIARYEHQTRRSAGRACRVPEALLKG